MTVGRRESRSSLLLLLLLVLGLGAVPVALWPAWTLVATVVLAGIALARVSREALVVIVAMLSLALGVAVWPGLTLAVVALAAIVVLAWIVPPYGFVAALTFVAAEGSVKMAFTFGESPLPVSPLALGALLVDLGLAAGIAGLLAAGGGRALRELWNDFDRVGRTAVVLLGAWLAASVLQVFQSGDITKGLAGLRVTQAYAAVAVGGILFLLAAKRDRRVVLFLLAALGVVAGYAALRALIGPSIEERTYAVSRPGVTQYVDAFRNVGSFSGAVGLASYLVPASVFAFALAVFAPRYRVLGLVVFACAVAGIVSTYTRAAILAVALGLVLTAMIAVRGRLLSRRSKAIAVIAVTAAIGAGAAATALSGRGSPQLEERAQAFVDPAGDRSLRLRLSTWKETLEVIVEHPLGTGLGAVGQASSITGEPTVTTDNSYLKIAREQGLLVAPLFALGLLLACIGVARKLGDASPPSRSTGIAALLAVVSFLGLAGTGEYIEQPGKVVAWAMLGIAAGAAYGGRTHDLPEGG